MVYIPYIIMIQHVSHFQTTLKKREDQMTCFTHHHVPATVNSVFFGGELLQVLVMTLPE